MFYSDVILSKRGPLAKVWLAAHAERRLTKSQLLQTDIEQTVSSIIGPDVVPMALRLSGQLLLGVVRIYSRKTRYLLDDCNDALSKLKTAFRTGAIDFTTDTNAAATSGDNVTLPVTRTAFDLGLPDPALEGWDAESSIGGDLPRRSITRSDRYTARPSDITLRRYFEPIEGNGESSGWASGEFFDPDASSGGGGDIRPEQLQRRDSQGRLIDENGDLIIGGEERDDDVSSIGIGRDAQMQIGGPRPSLSVVGDLTGFDDLGMEQFLMPEGEGLDLGLEEFDAQRRSLTPVRQTRSSSVMLENLTPRTAIKVQQAAQRRAQAAQRASRKQIIDSRTQLDDSAQNRQYSKGTEGIVLAQPSFLPSKRQHIDLLEIQADPSKGVSPFIQSDSILNSSPGKQTLQSAKDLAPELATLFTFDPSAMLRRRLAMEEDVLQQGPRPQKRTRAEEEEEYASEIGRRAVETGMGGGAELTFDTMDDFDPFGGQQQIEPAELTTMTAAGFDLGEDIIMSQTGGLRRSQRKRKTGFEEEGEDEIDQEVEEERRRISAFQQRGELERLSTPGEDGSVIGSSIGEDVSPTPSYPLRSFDAPTAGDSSASATGLSRNTLRAVRVLKSQLPHPAEVEDEDEEQTQVELSQITQNASRRAASAFFFELLALGTKDCIGVEQEEPYGEIKIKAKTGLWSLQRSGSVTA